MNGSASDEIVTRAPGAIIVLSPHADDAALSVGGLMQKAGFRSLIHILTLFGRSNYLRSTGFEKDWQLVTERRKREDVAFATRIGAKLSYLDFPEAALRLGSSFGRIFVDGSQAQMSIPRELMAKVRQVVERAKPQLLFSPLGLGGHRDHLITRNLAQTIGRRQNIPLVYYEDLPYATELSERKLLKHVRSLNSKLRPAYVSIESELESKLDNLTLYRSQIGIEEMEAVDLHAKRWHDFHAAERIWSTARPPALLG